MARTMKAGKSRRANVHRGETGQAVRLAFVEFLTLPVLIVLAFMALAVLVFLLDYLRPGMLEPARAAIQKVLFPDAKTTVNVLQTMAATVITVTSITVPLLLVALQQAASGLSTQVLDQFLRRRVNQVYTGFFVGLGVFCLLAAATSDPGRNPVYAATAALVLSVIGFNFLILLFYTTINQTRSPIILEAIHDHAADARVRQLHWLKTTRSAPAYDNPPCRMQVHAELTGFIMHVDVAALEKVLRTGGPNDEVVLSLALGAYVAYHDVIAEVRCDSDEQGKRIAEAVELAVRRERLRNVDHVDAGFGVEQLYDAGWTAASSAKHTPLAAINAIVNLRDLLARWAEDTVEQSKESRVVYTDNVLGILTAAFESILAAAAEARNPRVCAEVLSALAATFARSRPSVQHDLEAIILRALPLVTGLPVSALLETALDDVEAALESCGADRPLERVRHARRERQVDARDVRTAAENLGDESAPGLQRGKAGPPTA
ncbi:DUF2254 domain-containing protein [Paenarthrobacter sp. DKR-5]|uniref:DUF2254 family protein n=1 Tax=Paenarthrobacter sp. DKR-5 TaxID=2835535 RepID=UPI001BDD366F|nr:DUF2254 family protein [Paenarthrobacter sp. DKR-5]MBT1002934.1 DUF2254 domain-containing protein [Paenarthrobacter sp. DKR-5]